MLFMMPHMDMMMNDHIDALEHHMLLTSVMSLICHSRPKHTQ